MWMLIKVLILGMMVKLTINWERPFLWAFLYALAMVPAQLIHDPPFVVLMISFAVTFGLAGLYLWLLNDVIEEGRPLWWLVMVVGFVAATFY